MRQVLSWRFVVTLAALVGLAVFVDVALAAGNDEIDEIAGVGPPVERTPGLIALVLEAEQDGFAMSSTGTSEGTLTLTLPPAVERGEPRSISIFAGTPGEVTCTELAELARCALLAEVLGDTVTWFALVPMGASFRFELPAIVELDGGLASLANGWAVPYAPVIDRSECGSAETFSEFLRTVGQAHSSIFSLAEGEVVAVRC